MALWTDRLARQCAEAGECLVIIEHEGVFYKTARCEMGPRGFIVIASGEPLRTQEGVKPATEKKR